MGICVVQENQGKATRTDNEQTEYNKIQREIPLEE